MNNIIEFEQIVGRGTRLFEGKDYLKIRDFVKASARFSDPEWDGEPVEPEVCPDREQFPCECEEPERQPCAECGEDPCVCKLEVCDHCRQTPCVCITPPKKRYKMALADGKERELQHMVVTTFWHPDGTPMSAQQFLDALFGELPELFTSEAGLREIWSVPHTRTKLLAGLAEEGFADEQLHEMKKLISAEKSDLFDVLA